MGQQQAQFNNQQLDCFKHRFIITDHPNYPKTDTIYLLHQKLTNKQYILCIKANADDKQRNSLQEMLCKKLALSNPNITPLEQYVFDERNRFCSKQNRCYMTFYLGNAVSLKHKLLQNKCQQKQYSEEQLLSNIERMVNAIAWLRHQNHPHENISSESIYVQENQFLLTDPWIAPLKEPPGIYPSPQKLMKINDLIQMDDPYTSDIFSLGMVILQCLYGTPRGVYKSNGKIDSNKLSEYIHRCKNIQLRNKLTIMLLGKVDKRKQLINGLMNQRKLGTMIKLTSRKAYNHSNNSQYSPLNHQTTSTKIHSIQNTFLQNYHSNNSNNNKNNNNNNNNNINNFTPNINPNHNQVYLKHNTHPNVNYQSTLKNTESLDKIEKNKEKTNKSQFKKPIINLRGTALQKNQHSSYSSNKNPSIINNLYNKQQSAYYRIPQNKNNIETKLNKQSHKQIQKNPNFIFDPLNLKKSQLISYSHSSKIDFKPICSNAMININPKNQYHSHQNNFKTERITQKYSQQQIKSNQINHKNIQESLQKLKQKIKHNFQQQYNRQTINYPVMKQSNSMLNMNSPLLNPTTVSIINPTKEQDISIPIYNSTQMVNRSTPDINSSKSEQIRIAQSIETIRQSPKQSIRDSQNHLITGEQEKTYNKSLKQQAIQIQAYQKQQNNYYANYNPILLVENDKNLEKVERKQQEKNIIPNNSQIRNSSIIPQDSQQSYDSNDEEVGQYVQQYYENGGHYKGYVKNGKRSGQGAFFYKDGGYYQGHWKQNMMNGYGRLYYDTGHLAYQGYWKKDEFHGRGKVYNDNPNPLNQQFNYLNFENIELYWEYYEGNLEHDSKQGHGKIMLSNGQSYQGEFKNDKVNGKGVYKTKTGSIIKGIWIESKFIKTI